MVAIALPVLGHAAGGVPLGTLFAVGIALVIVAGAPGAIPVTIVFSFVFQNTIVSLITPLLHQEDFNLARSYNFMLVATFWAAVTYLYFIGRANFPAGIAQVLRLSYIVLLLVGAYFVFGAIHDANGAIIYLRNIATPLMCLQIGVIVGFMFRPTYVPALAVIAVLTLLYGLAELVFQMEFLRLINGDIYYRMLTHDAYDSGFWVKQMQDTGFVIRDPSAPGTGILFNYFKDWDIQVHRLLGPNFHPVSFTYAMCFFVILMVAAGHGFIYLLLAIPVLVVAGSKGALVYLLVTLAGVVLVRYYRPSGLFLAFVAILVLYAVVAFVLALNQGNYHALGFLGGINQFLSQPIGHGLGSGGNLITKLHEMDWSEAQHSGQSDKAVESAVAVLLFQMGIAAFAYFAFLFWLAARCWTDFLVSGRPLLAAASFGLAALTINGIFQEEAMFAPLALALMMLLGGIELGAASAPRRQQPVSLVRRRRPVLHPRERRPLPVPAAE